MADEYLGLFARAADAFNRRDLEGFIAHCDPEIEFTDLLMELEGGGSFHGHDGVRAWWKDYYATFPDVSQEIHEVRELGGDVLLVRGRTRGRPLGTGSMGSASFEQAFWLLVVVRGGKAIRWGSFRTEADALEAAGVSE